MERHFNKLSPAEQERLSLLLEEMAEVTQVIGKIQRHGYESHHPENPAMSNRQLLENELGHILFSLGLMKENQDINWKNLSRSKWAKERTVAKWLHHQD